MAVRTPLRVQSQRVWVNSETGTVRFGIAARYRTLLAGLAPNCYLLTSSAGGELETWVFNPESTNGWQFRPNRGVAAAVRERVKPAWCSAIESVMPDPAEDVSSWLEVGIASHPAPASCSVPRGALPKLQGRLMQHHLSLTYITQLADADGR